MSNDLTLAAEKRTEFGKGAARRARAAHKIPAVLYGHGADPLHVLLPGHDTMMAVKHSNALLTIDVDGEKHSAIAKDVQVDAVKQSIDHIDLLLVRKGEKLTVDVAIHLEGESAPGTIHTLEHSTVQVLAEATHLPESVTANIEGLEEGDRVLASELVLPKGTELVTDADAVVVLISVPRSAVAAEDEETAEEASEEAATEESAE